VPAARPWGARLTTVAIVVCVSSYENTHNSLAELQRSGAAEFGECFKDPTAAERVRRDIELGLRMGVSGTPTFFVNGRRVADSAQLEAAIEEAFEHAQANQP
jgi:protein-disulfide isomerase